MAGPRAQSGYLVQDGTRRTRGVAQAAEEQAKRRRWARTRQWSNRPVEERRALLAVTDEVDVCYTGALVGGVAADVFPRARGRVRRRSGPRVEVELLADLTIGPDGTLVVERAGTVVPFTTGGKHKVARPSSLICVPAGWAPEPYPASEDRTSSDDEAGTDASWGTEARVEQG